MRKVFFFVTFFVFLSFLTEAQWSTVNPYTYVLTTTNRVGIGTTSPSIGKLQIGSPGNSDSNKIVIPGLYNFEKVKLGEYPNGAAALEFINHIDFVSSFGVRLMANVDQGVKGLLFQYAPPVSTESGLTYSNGMFLRATDGYLGIGTTNPQSLLAVKGILTAQKVVVTQSGWSDYVFDSSYQLLSLDTVENFIQTNKHLPDVPSAKEIQADGNDLADNQRIMLQKIEELTLYIIGQNKQITKQNKKIEALQTEVAEMKKHPR